MKLIASSILNSALKYQRAPHNRLTLHRDRSDKALREQGLYAAHLIPDKRAWHSSRAE